MPRPPADPARYRYGAVFLLTLALLVFVIVALAADWSRAVALLLEGAALVVAVATSRARSDVRRTRAAALTVVGALVVGTVAAGLVPVWGTLALGGVLAVAIPLTLVRGLVRLVGTAGATLQAVAGALSIYLLIGLVFAWVIGLAAHIDDAPYFAGGIDGGEGERAYYSLAVLTTTGFGDLHGGPAARPRAGRRRGARRTALSGDRHRSAHRQPRAAAGGLRCDGGRRDARCGGQFCVTRTS